MHCKNPWVFTVVAGSTVRLIFAGDPLIPSTRKVSCAGTRHDAEALPNIQNCVVHSVEQCKETSGKNNHDI